jgi:hypothetical protein
MEVFESEILILSGILQDGFLKSTDLLLHPLHHIAESRTCAHRFMVTGSRCSDLDLYLSRHGDVCQNSRGWDLRNACDVPLLYTSSGIIAKAIVYTLPYAQPVRGTLEAFQVGLES